jgi:lipopolysaccharide/colanic/teichoic acid biosynthesis glycosyltransferase
MVQLDIEYSERMSLWLDFKIMFKTFSAIWTQYSDLRAYRKQAVRPEASLGKTAESIRI